jgi:hypothetical protein
VAGLIYRTQKGLEKTRWQDKLCRGSDREFCMLTESKHSFGKTYDGILFRMSVGEIPAMTLTVRMMI